MPTYEYKCSHCEYEFEELQSMKEPALIHCPKCNTDSLVRLMGTGGAMIFKGSGFYLTDYKGSSTSKPAASAPKPKDTSGDSAKS